MRAARRLAICLAFAVTAVFVAAGAAFAASTTLVISQFQVAGGTAADEFVELHNVSTTQQALGGFKLAYRSAAGTSDVSLVTFPSPTVVPAGGFVLVGAQSSGVPLYDGATPADFFYSTGSTGSFAGASGGLALRNAAGAIVDSLGYGTATNAFVEGTPAATPVANAADVRKQQGCQDTDANAADFVALNPSAPRNSASTPVQCGVAGDSAPSVSSTTPAAGATAVATDTNVTVSFSEPVATSDPWYSIVCSSSGTHAASASAGLTTFTLDPATDFAAGETCTVTVLAAGVTDTDVVDPPDTMAADYAFSFTTLAPPRRIHEIQGAAHISPLVNQNVTGVTGIVTQKISNGFFMQDPDPDADPATSEGIFVFTSSAPAGVTVGDAVKVNGRVSEFRSGTNNAANTNLTLTELGSVTVTVLSSGNVLPAATPWSPPTETIEDDATGNVETSGAFDPAQDGLDYFESLEGMRVSITDATVTGPSRDFTSSQTTEVPVVGAGAGIRTPRGGIVIRANDFNPERIILQSTLGQLPAMNVGDSIPGTTVGVLDYNFGNFKLKPSAPVTYVRGNLLPEVTDTQSPQQLSVATFNVENLSPLNPQSKFDRLSTILVHNLKAPDVVAIEEIQDNTGATEDAVTPEQKAAADDGTVASDVTLDRLVDAIAAAGGPRYQWRYIAPENNKDGGAPSGNIRVAFLFNADRVSFVDRGNAGTFDANDVVGTGDSTELKYSPGRIDPTSSAWEASRKPLAGEFVFRGHKVFVIANHFASKGGDDPLMGRYQPPTRSSEVKRHLQAQEVRDFTQKLLTADPSANVIVAGDLNDFQFSETVHILEQSGISALIDTLPVAEQYTYDFDGNSQAIDHILVAPALAALVRSGDYDVVHVNSEFADQASDHEPQVARFLLNDAPTVSIGGTYSVGEGSTVPVTATGSDPEGGSLTYAWDLDGNGSFETSGQSPVFSAAGLDGPSTAQIAVQVTDDGGLTATASTTVTITNVAPSATFSATPAVFAGSPILLSLTNQSDPSAADTSAGFAYAFDCGSGTFVASATPTASCPTTDTGTPTLRGRITDKDGGFTIYTATSSVTVTAASLCDLTTAYVTKEGVANSLCVKLQHGSYGAYANEVAAQSGKSLTAEQAATLTRLVGRL